MAGFRKDRTTAAQTAANSAATLTAARVANGELKGVAVDKALVASYKALFGSDELLSAVVESDNKVFAAVEAEGGGAASKSPTKSAAKTTKTAAKSGAASGKQQPTDNPGALAFNKGKYAGLTIEEVAALSEEEVIARGGREGDTGLNYIEWTSTDANPNEYMRKAAQAFLAEQAA